MRHFLLRTTRKVVYCVDLGIINSSFSVTAWIAVRSQNFHSPSLPPENDPTIQGKGMKMVIVSQLVDAPS
jgi:hypothetical protein